jgi:CRP-like cAMP-binding protein
MKILLGFSQQIRALDEALMVHTLELAPEKPLNADDNRFVQKENTRQYPAGAVIFNEGDPGTELFIIQKGVVRIIKAEKNREIVLALLKSGEIFGEMGLLENKPRSACAVAHEDCELMAVNKDNYDQIIAQPKIVLKLTTLLADRIWFLNKQIANHRIPSLDDRLCNMLAVFLEKEDVQLSIKSHTFAFTANELLDMTGIDRQEGTTALRAIVMSGLIKMDNDRITVLHPTEVLRKDEVFWKLHR